MSELQVVNELPDLQTGEALPATPDNAARVRLAAAEIINQMRAVQARCDEVLGEEARRLGTKTLHLDGHKVVLTGGKTIDIDPIELMENLRDVDCPEDRITKAVKQTVIHKVDRAVVRQLSAANEDYKMAIELASVEVEKPWKASVQ